MKRGEGIAEHMAVMPADARMGRRVGLAGLLAGIGLTSLAPYAYALQLHDLRKHTVEFEFAFFVAFVLYLLAVALVLREDRPSSARTLALVFGLAIAFRGLLVFTPPTLSDDMYRYVWDGRVQASQINPYAYPPEAPELAPLRDEEVWPSVNRKWAVTIYPGGAQLAFAGLWQLWPDSVRWFQVVMAVGGLLGGILLVLLLRACGRPAHLVLIYLWNPLVIFETAHSAHVDGLILPLLVVAWLARIRGRNSLVGLTLGAATALKLYPALLVPALWYWPRDGGKLRAGVTLLLGFAAVPVLSYLPYVSQGLAMFGYIPTFAREHFNPSPAALLLQMRGVAWGDLETAGVWVAPGVLGLTCLWFVMRPSSSTDQAFHRCAFLIGAFLLSTQNLHPWYVLWLVPLVTIYLRPGRLGFRLDAWTGWLLFTGLVVLAYTHFIDLKPVYWVQYLEFLPLFALLITPWAWRGIGSRLPRRLAHNPSENRGLR